MPTSSPSSSTTTASPSGDGAAEAAAAPAWLDLGGEVCPFTFVRTRLALEALPLGATLRVRVDHGPARVNVPRSATEWGQQVVAVTEDGGAWVIELIKRVS